MGGLKSIPIVEGGRIFLEKKWKLVMVDRIITDLYIS